MSWQSTDQQIQKIVGFLNEKGFKKETYIAAMGQLLSLSTELKAIQTYERRYEYHLDSASSGDSSPCISDSERNSRYVMPTVEEVSELLTEDAAVDIDYAIERLKDSKNKETSLLFENIDGNLKKRTFLGFFKDTRASGYSGERILTVKDAKMIIFHGRPAFVVNVYIRKPEYIVEYLTKLQGTIFNTSRIQPRISYVVQDRQKAGRWHAVVVRNLPPTVTHKEISDQCQKDVFGGVYVGTITKIKDKCCCVIRCDYLEDAELICKRLNNFQLKNPNSEKYTIKAHLHPRDNLNHLLKEKSIFANVLMTQKKPAKPRQVNEILDIFRNASKSKGIELEKTKSEIKEKEAEETKAHSDVDSLMRRFSSTIPSLADKGISTLELQQQSSQETSDLRKLIESTEAKNAPAEKEEGEAEEQEMKEERKESREEEYLERKEKKHDRHKGGFHRHDDKRHNVKKYHKKHDRHYDDYEKSHLSTRNSSTESDRNRHGKGYDYHHHRDRDTHIKRGEHGEFKSYHKPSKSRSRSRSPKRPQQKRKGRSRSKSRSEKRSISKERRRHRSRSNSKKDKKYEEKQVKTTLYEYNFDDSKQDHKSSSPKERNLSSEKVEMPSYTKHDKSYYKNDYKPTDKPKTSRFSYNNRENTKSFKDQHHNDRDQNYSKYKNDNSQKKHFGNRNRDNSRNRSPGSNKRRSRSGSKSKRHNNNYHYNKYHGGKYSKDKRDWGYNDNRNGESHGDKHDKKEISFEN